MVINYCLCLFSELCPPHHYSNTGFHPCLPCPHLHYQLYIGQRQCFPCYRLNETELDICRMKQTSTTAVSSSSTDDTKSSKLFRVSSLVKTKGWSFLMEHTFKSIF